MTDTKAPLPPPGSLADTKPRIQVLRHQHVCDRLQISSAKLSDMVAKGQFPRPFLLIPGGRAVGWLEADVDAWILARRHSGDKC